MTKNLNPRVNVNNLRFGDSITLVGKTGYYEGCPMRFKSKVGPLIYVAVDSCGKGEYGYHTSFNLNNVEVLRLPKNALKQSFT